MKGEHYKYLLWKEGFQFSKVELRMKKRWCIDGCYLD